MNIMKLKWRFFIVHRSAAFNSRGGKVIMPCDLMTPITYQGVWPVIFDHPNPLSFLIMARVWFLGHLLQQRMMHVYKRVKMSNLCRIICLPSTINETNHDYALFSATNSIINLINDTAIIIENTCDTSSVIIHHWYRTVVKLVMGCACPSFGPISL